MELKIITKEDAAGAQLQSQRTNEIYSFSRAISEALGSKQLLIYRDTIAPGRNASGRHRHTLIEEVVYVSKGTATVRYGANDSVANEGSFILFEPKDRVTHTLANRTTEDIEILTFSIDRTFDSVIFEDTETQGIRHPSSHFNEDLWDIPDKPDEWYEFVADLTAKLGLEANQAMRLEYLQHLGMALRTLQQLDQAEKYLMQAVSLSYSHPNKVRLLQNLIRLAHVYQWKKEFAKAHLLFDQAKALMAETTVSEILTAAYHQHLGKLLFDEALYKDARVEFETALVLRTKISAPKDQLESTQASLRETLRQLK